MGWLYTDKYPGTSVADFFKSRWNQETGTDKCEVLACAVVKLRTAYIAVKHTRKASNTTVVYAVVVLLDYVKNKQFNNFGYKDICELSGPLECECPQSIMDLLSPVEEVASFLGSSAEHAKEWRGYVQAHHESAKKRKGFFHKGVSYELKEPVRMTNGLEVKQMKVLSTKPLRFFSPEHGFRFKLSQELVRRAIANDCIKTLA